MVQTMVMFGVIKKLISNHCHPFSPSLLPLWQTLSVILVFRLLYPFSPIAFHAEHLKFSTTMRLPVRQEVILP